MRSLLVLFLVLPTISTAASTQRGVWFWGASGDPWGSVAVVGDVAAETAARNHFIANGISNVYGSYQNRPVSDLAAIASWNSSLSGSGITSDLLLSENSWLDPANHASMTSKIQDRILTFNSTVPTAAEFRGLHLDIEPQGLDTWGAMTPADKKAQLYLLSGLYSVARTYLNDNGGSAITLAGDLPVWFDSSPSIGWDDDAERDAWFAGVGTTLDSVSLMPFDRDTFSSIDNGVSWELANISGAGVRVGLETDIPGTWPDSAAFYAMADEIETAYGDSVGIDIQSFASFAGATIPEPGCGVLVLMVGGLGAVRRKR